MSILKEDIFLQNNNFRSKLLWSEKLYILKCGDSALPYQVERPYAKTELSAAGLNILHNEMSQTCKPCFPSSGPDRVRRKIPNTTVTVTPEHRILFQSFLHSGDSEHRPTARHESHLEFRFIQNLQFPAHPHITSCCFRNNRDVWKTNAALSSDKARVTVPRDDVADSDGYEQSFQHEACHRQAGVSN